MFFYTAMARIVLLGLVMLLFSSGCAAKRNRVFVTGLFNTQEEMDTSYQDLKAKDRLYKVGKVPGRLTEHDLRNAGFNPYKEKNGLVQPVDNVNVLDGHKAFDEVFKQYPDTYKSFEPSDFVKIAEEKSLWTIEAYRDERIGGTEPFIYINTEENKPKGSEAWYFFVLRLNPELGIREIIMLSKEVKTERGEDTVSAPLKGILGGMGRIVGGATTGLSKGF